MTETPTPEWLARFAHDRAVRSISKQTAGLIARSAQIEALHRDDEIDDQQLEAWHKYERCTHGAAGHDVRRGEGDGHPDMEYPRSYYAQKLDAANNALTPIMYAALRSQIEHETPWPDLGRLITCRRDRAQARVAAVLTITYALDILAYHWGFKTKEKPA